MIIDYISLVLEFIAGILTGIVLLIAYYDKSKLTKCGMSILFVSMWFSAISTLRVIIDPHIETYINYSITIFSVGIILINVGFIKEKKINIRDFLK